MVNFESNYSIDDSITFIPMFKQATEMGIAQEQMEGTIVSIRFTKAKVFYDILDDYYGRVFTNVDSSNVYPIQQLNLKE
jgi:hypothetical protein